MLSQPHDFRPCRGNGLENMGCQSLKGTFRQSQTRDETVNVLLASRTAPGSLDRPHTGAVVSVTLLDTRPLFLKYLPLSMAKGYFESVASEARHGIGRPPFRSTPRPANPVISSCTPPYPTLDS